MLAAGYKALGDAELAHRCAARDAGAIRHLISANNQRLFRTAWSILKNRAEAEEAVQAAYMSAFTNMAGFEARSSLSTWLTRIVVDESLAGAAPTSAAAVTSSRRASPCSKPTAIR